MILRGFSLARKCEVRFRRPKRTGSSNPVSLLHEELQAKKQTASSNSPSSATQSGVSKSLQSFVENTRELRRNYRYFLRTEPRRMRPEPGFRGFTANSLCPNEVTPARQTDPERVQFNECIQKLEDIPPIRVPAAIGSATSSTSKISNGSETR
jgi:hypothetical protein